MSPLTDPDIPRIERFHHRAYETVRSADLNDQEAAQDALRSWHNRALHATYGVSFGLDVQSTVTEPGAWKFHVQRGLAYDVTGRPLYTTGANVEVPYDPRGMTLVLRAGPGGPELAWVPTQGFRLTDGVGLAKTLATKDVENVTLKPGLLPPELKDKVSYDSGRHVLTIYGPLSVAQYDALRTAVEAASQDAIDSAFADWPMEAPRQSRGINGLQVRIQPGTEADGTLWVAAVSPGSAVTESGTTLRLERPTRLPLNAAKDSNILVLQAQQQGPPSLALFSKPPTIQDKAVQLRRITPVAGAITFAETIPAQVDPIKAMLNGLKNLHKVANDLPEQLTIVGFLTRDERDRLIDIVSAWDIGRIPEAHALLQSAPVAGAVSLPQERAPFFPIRSRPLARPRTASGQTVPERTEWKQSPTDALGNPSGTGTVLVTYETTVSIESAGFTEVPRLFAWLQETEGSQGDRAENSTGANPRFLLPPLVAFRGEIDDCRLTINQFVFRVWLVPVAGASGWVPVPPPITEYLRDSLYVRWLAVQREPAAPEEFVVPKGLTASIQSEVES
jgi:hypothetical protein